MSFRKLSVLGLLFFLGNAALTRAEQHDHSSRVLRGGGGSVCDVDVFVVGLGWAGVGALYELQRYNNFCTGGKKLKFKGADKAPVIGGRAIAARVVSGKKGNPVFDFVKDLYTRNPKKENYLPWSVVDWSKYQAYDTNGKELPRREIRRTQKEFDDAFDCLYLKAETVNYPATTTTQEVLKECNWHPPANGGDFANVLTSWDFDLELLFTNDLTSILNFPLWTYLDYGFKDVFIPIEGNITEGKPSNAAGVADRVARTYIKDFDDTIMFNTEVTKINWNEGGCVEIETDNIQTGKKETITAGKVIFTGSAGVLNSRGDGEYGEDPLFHPPLPETKLDALRKTFFLEGGKESEPGLPRRTMSTYKELIVQLGPDVDLSKDPNKNFLFIETKDGSEMVPGKRGHCNVWQSVDRQKKEFFPGSRAYICELGVSVVNEDPNSDNIGMYNPDLEFTETELKDIVEATLGNVLGLPETCKRVFEPLKLTPPITAKDSECLFQIFDGNEPEFGEWDGSWSTFMATDWTMDDYYNKIKPPLLRNDDPNDPRVFFAGEHTCLRYNGYVNGAYFSGLQEANNVLEAILPKRDYKKWKRNASFFNCDV